MKQRRSISTSRVSFSDPSWQGVSARTTSRRSGWFFCGIALFLFGSTAYIIQSTIELFTTDKEFKKRTFSTIDSDGPISSRGTSYPNSTKNCDIFDHGDVSPFPNLTSVFNCNSPSGKCVWFYPAKFFNQYCGIGKKYAGAIDYMESQRIESTLWKRGPPIVLPWVSLHPGIKPNGKHPGRTLPLPLHNLSMVHVHKTGGTSLVTAFSSLSSHRNIKGKRMITYQPMTSRRRPRARAKKHKKNVSTKLRQIVRERAETLERDIETRDPRYRKESGAFLDGAVKYRRNWGEREHTLLAVVRDPAERFISAIGQATGAYGSSNNGVADWLKDTCLKKTGTATLRCFVDVMMKNGTWIEVHFTPMALEISFATMYKDIPVAVFPFIEVPTLMYELNQKPGVKKKDGKKKGFRKSKVLTTLSVRDYDEETLRDLCNVYEVDVLFLQHIGYATKCDSYITFK